MKTVILAGGLGTRLAEETKERPKPMVEIGEHPILWHIMNIYAAAGFTDFVIALGYRGEQIKDYFRYYRERHSDLVVELGSGKIQVAETSCPDWTVQLVDTGPKTQTGGRIKRLQRWIGSDTFLLTYGDGVADVDILRAVDFHRRHGRLATVTSARPLARFGLLQMDGTAVTGFSEKPIGREGRINAGFFVLEPGIFDYIQGDETIWERDPLERLARDDQLQAYEHDGFFQPMDTLRERQVLDQLWSSGEAPWKVW